MLGSRALYHEGWKAVVFHALPGVAYDGSDPNLPFDEDEWELYHVADDFAETVDLAGKEPEKLQQLIERWWSEAERFNVLPVNNRPTSGADRRFRRERSVFRPGIGSLPEAVAPNLRNRGWRMIAELIVTADTQGVIAAHGGPAGGYAVYVDGGRLCYAYNHLGTTLTTITAEAPLPSGPVLARVEFTPTGTFEGDVDLYYGDVPVGQGHVPRTTMFTYGTLGFTVGYQPARRSLPPMWLRQSSPPVVSARSSSRPPDSPTATPRSRSGRPKPCNSACRAGHRPAVRCRDLHPADGRRAARSRRVASEEPV